MHLSTKDVELDHNGQDVLTIWTNVTIPSNMVLLYKKCQSQYGATVSNFGAVQKYQTLKQDKRFPSTTLCIPIWLNGTSGILPLTSRSFGLKI